MKSRFSRLTVISEGMRAIMLMTIASVLCRIGVDIMTLQ